jgi:hypothetical protein
MAKKLLHPHIRQLLLEIDDYCNRAGVSRTTFGVQAMKDGNFIPRLEQGRQPKFDTIDRVRAFISSKTKAVRSSQTTRRSNVV